MPIYSYKCSICGNITDQYNTIDGRKNGPNCNCGGNTSLTIQPTQIAPILGGGDFPGYQCPVTDKFITSRRERRNIMAEHNLVEVGDRGPSKKRQEQTELANST